MALYGTKICGKCIGYGIKLTSAEYLTIMRAVTARKPLDLDVQRENSEIERCSRCKGTGWVFVKDCTKIVLPFRTWKR